jgi:hypothetical protein
MLCTESRSLNNMFSNCIHFHEYLMSFEHRKKINEENIFNSFWNYFCKYQNLLLKYDWKNYIRICLYLGKHQCQSSQFSQGTYLGWICLIFSDCEIYWLMQCNWIKTRCSLTIYGNPLFSSKRSI